MKPEPLAPIPEDTLLLAEQVLKADDRFLRIGREYAELVQDEEFAGLYSPLGQPAVSPRLLALVTLLQAIEHCSDRQAVRMLATRIDWKYALHLRLGYVGFDASVLCEFRARLIEHGSERLVFDRLIERLRSAGLLSGLHIQRTDSAAIVAHVRCLTRLELAQETLRLGLEALIQEDACFVTAHLDASWLERYVHPANAYRLAPGRQGVKQAEKLLAQTREDGALLLALLERSQTPKALLELDAVVTLFRVWSQQFPQKPPPPDEPGKSKAEPAPSDKPASQKSDRSSHIESPHDTDARYGCKGARPWSGYKVHVTECADKEAPAIITDIDVSPAYSYDSHALPEIQERLIDHGLSPDKQLADSTYVNSESIEDSLNRGIELIGPARLPNASSDREDAILSSAFRVDVANRQASCPGGAISSRFDIEERSTRPGQKRLVIQFSKTDCQGCALRERCLSSGQQSRRLYLSEGFEQLQQRRKEQEDPAFWRTYARRSGLEATLSHTLNHRQGRQTPYVGTEKTDLHYLFLAAGINLTRAIDWQQGKRPKRERLTRLSRFLDARKKATEQVQMADCAA